MSVKHRPFSHVPPLRDPPTPPPPSETKLSEAIDAMLFAQEEVVANAKGCDTRPGSGQRLIAARSSLESLYREQMAEIERQAREIKAMSEMYTQVTSPLQECCQRHKLGLGGEFCHELVIEEVDRLRSLQLTPEEAQMILDSQPMITSVTREKLRISSKATSEEL